MAGNPPPPPAAGEELELEGTLEHVLYRTDGPHGEFIVARLRVRGEGSITAVGQLPPVPKGERIRLIGNWVQHPRHGNQFVAAAAFPVLPASAAGVERFLASGLIRGVGPVLAKRIVAAFGDETLNVLEHEPKRVAVIPGIGPKRAASISVSLGEQRHVRELLIFLRGHEVPTGVALRIHRAWGNQAIPRLQENPWRLATEIGGIGFRTTDAIARRLGLPEDSIHRAAAAALHALGEAAGAGHVLVERDQLIEIAEALLAPADSEAPRDPPPVAAAIDELRAADRIVVDGEAVYQPRLHQAEVDLASRVRRLVSARPRAPLATFDDDLATFERRQQLELAAFQRDAVRAALSCSLLVITGGPGTGKTTLVKAIVALATRAGLRLALAAPTGRAAKRLSEASDHDATTLHRLLEFSPQGGGFTRDEGNPLEAGLTIVDEASMLDLPLAASLLAAIPLGGRLVLVGDVDQLPSVGPGSVLRDLIASGVAEVVRLERIYRQSGGSRIVENAHRVLGGLLPVSASGFAESGADYFAIEREDPVEARATIEHLVAERIPARFGFDPLRDIQVLAPMHRGDIGTQMLNQTLQQRLNPDGRKIPAGRGMRVGDRVLQTRNNYELGIFNGDLGRISGLDAEEGVLQVDFDGREVEIERLDQDDLLLAYATSVHKAQGSEYPCVVLALHTQHYVMLQRNLLYTALTRGRRLVVVVGNRRAIALAVRNASTAARAGRLVERVRGEGRGKGEGG